MEAEFFIDRDYEGRMCFGCLINKKRISFFPEIEVSEEGVYVGPIGISGRILECTWEEIAQIKKVFNTNHHLMNSYFQVFIGSEWGPIPKSIYETVLTLELTEEEITTVQECLDRFTYIYLIRDRQTGLTKIGRSDTPFDRLKTLVRQDTLMPQPNDFYLMFAWAGYPYHEKMLHKQFDGQRVRGEWFDLDQEDIEEIRSQFYSEKDLVTGKSKNDEYEESWQKYQSNHPEEFDDLSN